MKGKLNQYQSVGAALAGVTLLTLSGTAASAPVSATLEMVCPFPLIGDQTLIANISADAPEVINLATNPDLAPIQIETITKVPDRARQGLAFVGAETITGTAINIATLHSNAGQDEITNELAIVPTTIPAGESGPFDVPANGFTPAFTFDESHIGEVSLSVDSLSLNLTNLTADGSIAPAPVGQFVSDCTFVAGQNTILATFEVVGIVVETPEIEVSPTTIEFGVLQLGQSASQTVTVSNVGALDLGINGISIANASDASAFVQANDCTVVAPGSSCSVEVTYTATEDGLQGADLVIQSNDEDEETVLVPMAGTGQLVLEPEIEVVSMSIDFGTIIEGTSSTQTVTVNNVGGAALTVNSVEVAGAQFTLANNNCATVAAGGNCTIDVTYNAVVGQSAGTLAISSNDDDETVVNLTLVGVGEEEVIVRPEPLEAAMIIEGSSFIKASRATLPLEGDLVALLDLMTGSFTADMQLAPTQGKFEVIQGWSRYLATAKVEFESVGITEGSLVDGKLTATYTAYIKVPKVTKTLFGIVDWPIGGGANCRTKAPVSFTVTSADGETFGPLTGGRVVGTYTLPKLEKCGLLTEILNLKMAGAGNTIDMVLTPNFN